MKYTIENVAECALRIRWPSSLAAPLREIRHAFTTQVVDLGFPGLLDVVPGRETVLVTFDPLQIEAGRVREYLSAILNHLEWAGEITARVQHLPICYDAEFALDLAELSVSLHLSPERIIELHLNAEYLVEMIGFAPGFPYLSGLPEALHSPRKSAPRTLVPSGSVGIGGSQTGIYSIASPGGWNIIGRTPCTLFDANRWPPALLLPCDRVRFRRISRAEFDTCFSEASHR